ncbi:MAG: DNA polymerase III subunit alpha [Bacteroidales bacterium]|nr:DNA polymerase III subunit alpha [Bacteroidales bacterium]
MYLIYDTETTGLPKDWNAPLTDSDNWPRMVQISWQIHDVLGQLIEVKNYIVKPEDYEIPYAVVKIHGITTERALKQGADLEFVLAEFNKALEKCQFVVGHNISFDNNIVGAEFIRKNILNDLQEKPILDTKDDGTDFCKLPGGRGGGYKYPKLGELHEKLFGNQFAEAHNAAADVEATARCFLEMIRLDVIKIEKLKISQEQKKAFLEANPVVIEAIGLNTQPYDPNDLNETKQTIAENGNIQILEKKIELVESEIPFSHLHLHTQYSLLDGASDIPGVATKAKKDGMKAVAITDHGNMFGVKLFHKTLTKEGIKPILGCEAYVARRSMHLKETKEDASGWHLVLLAKNKTGYSNLTQLISMAWLEGQYYKPRIDKELLEKHSEGLIVLSACLGGEVSQKIMNESIVTAKEAAAWYQSIFKDDFYLEIQRHQSGQAHIDEKIFHDQVFVNEKIIEIARELNIKVVATNDVHFIEPEDAEAQERLLCISTGKFLSDKNRMKYSGQEWMKTQKEMRAIFADIPEAIANTNEIVDKVEEYKLDRAPLMPQFEIPEEFGTMEQYLQIYDEEKLIRTFFESDLSEEEKMNRYQKLGGYEKVLRIKFEADYLKKVTYEGAIHRWGDEISDERKERLDFELMVIREMGFPGYFLIVWDFLKAARDMGVVVGPGRGSAAGSAAAYCLRITEIDPIKYNLLFERFLNPDRISMPDIDIDFDDDGRAEILKWVVNKYGEKRVAHIVTFGTMAAKSSIRDVGRVQQYPLSETTALQKLVPERPGVSLKEAFKEVKELREIREANNEASEVLKYAEVLEGSVRNTGTHACGIIIGADDLEKHIPISTTKDSELTYVTQYDGKHVEDVGLLKMDFLGLKTLSIIKDAVHNIKLSKGIDIDIDKIPLNDKKTYELYANGETTGLFQFESDGMKKHLRDLKPSRFEDLIAMNALYRPGPMEYIPSFVKRKHGDEPINYDVPMMKQYLEETYGITVYQEQVMLLSRLLAGFTRGESDSLRKAMGKKIKAMMDELKVKFVAGCKKNEQFVKECQEGKQDIDKTIEKIWSDWEAFAKYAFNKSHATCYSYVSYQTAYLKAHYPAEFMASVLSRNLSDITKVTFFMDECRTMGLEVAGPDVNHSHCNFTVDKKGVIRFGLEGIKGVGGAAVDNIIAEREQNGEFKDIFDFVKRIKLTSVNKKNIEALAYAGAFDGFKLLKRSQYFAESEGRSFIERLISFGNSFQTQSSNQELSLFDGSNAIEIAVPNPPIIEEWSNIRKLDEERKHIGVYLSAHPLDEFKYFIENGGFVPLKDMVDLSAKANQEIKICGFVTDVEHTFDKREQPVGYMTIEDYTGSYRVRVGAKDGYLNLKGFFTKDIIVYINGKVTAWEREGQETRYFFNTTGIDLMSNKKDSILKNLWIKVHLNAISDEMRNELSGLIQNNPGPIPLNFYVWDEETQNGISLHSKTYHVNANKKLINGLSNIENIEYQFNKGF